MKILVKIITVVVILVCFSACQNTSERNYEFFPNMYQSTGYETYSESSAFNDGVSAQLPVEGSIKRGWKPFEIENSPEGKAFAKDSLVSPLNTTVENLANGKELYNIYCAICHGKKGKGDGELVKREKFLGVPNYGTREMTEGSIYHVIYYGLNTMGSHAAQLDENERWQVAMYVNKLRTELKN